MQTTLDLRDHATPALPRPAAQPAPTRHGTLQGEPFVSPVANIPTNRTPLNARSKPR